MPPYRASGGRGAGAGAGAGAEGALSRGVNTQDNATKEKLTEITQGMDDVATGVGLSEHSFLDEGVHEKLVTQVKELAAANATLELKRKATTSALKSMAAEMDKRAARGPAGAGADDPPAEQMSLKFFLDEMQSKVSLAMEGADEKALESKEYKDVMKKIIPPDGNESEEGIIIPRGGTQVSLKCPCTAATLEDPVKSKRCGHTYGRVAIANHIRISKAGAASCPVAGCLHKVTMGDLVEDKDMKRRLRIEADANKTQRGENAVEIDEDDADDVGMTCI